MVVWYTIAATVVNIRYVYVLLNVRAYCSKIALYGSQLLGGTLTG